MPHGLQHNMRIVLPQIENEEELKMRKEDEFQRDEFLAILPEGMEVRTPHLNAIF